MQDLSGPTPPTRWLTDAEQRAWRGLSGVLVKLPALLDSQLQQDSGLRHFEYGIMARLSEQPDRKLRMSSLAIGANGSLSRLSHAVKRLEKLGLVVRETDPADGRYTVATLTAAGLETIVGAAPGHAEAVRAHVFDALTEEQVEQLRAITAAVLGRVDRSWPPDGSLDVPGA